MFDVQMESEVMISPMSCYCRNCAAELVKVTSALSVCPVCNTKYYVETEERDTEIKKEIIEVDEDLRHVGSATDV